MLLRRVFILSVFCIYASVFATEVVDSRKQVVGRKPKLRDPVRISASFSKLQPLISQIDDEKPLTIFRGVPRSSSSKKGAESNATDPSKLIKRYDFDFFRVPISIEPETRSLFNQLLNTPKTYKQFRGFKFCGGFHPDFSFVYRCKAGELEIQLCLTCHEIKLFQNRTEVYCDIESSAYEEIYKLIPSLDTNR